jgi:Ca2+-binding EF-hand superfamily protein
MDMKPHDWIGAKKVRIRDAFELFDKSKSGSILEEDVGTVIRALGVYPSEKQLEADIIPQLRGDENPGVISYRKLEKKVLSIMINHEYEPDIASILLQAFRTIDKANNGYLTTEKLHQLLSSEGTGFRPEELESFFAVAKDPGTENVYYEDYVSSLVKLR